jgi:hypothetical protein
MHQECIEGIDGFGCALLNTVPNKANRIRKIILLGVHSNNEHGDTGANASIIRHGGNDSNSCGKIQTNRASSIMTRLVRLPKLLLILLLLLLRRTSIEPVLAQSGKVHIIRRIAASSIYQIMLYNQSNNCEAT